MASPKKEKGANVSPVTQLPTDKDDSENKNGCFTKRDIVEAIIIAVVLRSYLIGRSNARTQKPKLKSICDKIGLSEKSVLMLARLKKENAPRLGVINMLLEQADEDISDDYELVGWYEGSVLNAVCRYLDGSAERYLKEEFEDYVSDPRRYDNIRGALHQRILEQAIEAIKMCHE